MLEDLGVLRWLFNDLGITSKVAFQTDLKYFGRFPKPGVNDLCPCGSGKKFKKCVHRWGPSGMPPET